MMKRLLTTLWTSLLIGMTTSAQGFSNGMEETMFASGRINVVIGVIAIIFVLFIVYLVRLDRKVSRLEQYMKDM